MMIRVIVVEDQWLVRDALVALLSLQPSIEVVGSGASGKEGVALVSELKPDVALLDIQMADGDGIWAVREIHRLFP